MYVGLRSSDIKFDPVLFGQCFWQFIRLTTLSDAACQKALKELIKTKIDWCRKT